MWSQPATIGRRVTAVNATLPCPTRIATGSSTTAPKMVIMKMPRVLCTHLPTDRPMVDVITISDRITADDNATNQLLLVIHAARGPIAYERYVAHCRPISDVNTIT